MIGARASADWRRILNQSAGGASTTEPVLSNGKSIMDSFITTTPFFSADHRTLADRMAQFVEREVEVQSRR